MLHFYYCQNYLDNTSDEIDTLLKKILNEFSKRTSLKGGGKVASFTKGVFVLKMKNPYSEVILEERKIDLKKEILTVYFVRGFKVSLQDYVEIRDGKWLEYNSLSQNDIDEFVKIYKQQNNIKEQALDSPPRNLTAWQNNYKLRVNYDIFESEDWVKFSSDNSGVKGMKPDEVKLFGLTLNDIVNNNKFQPKKDKIHYHIKDSCGIIFSIFEFDNKYIYYLIDGANVSSQKDKWDDIISRDFDIINNINSYNDITRSALKAYPSWALKDLDIWSKIQVNNILGNLSLLPEQTEFLKDFKFPKYINGQAGSGKSTMMYYLFANIYYYKSAGEITGDVIFLTENPRLLEHTRNSVIQLLINNPEFDLGAEYELIIELDKCFHPFKEFLLSFLHSDFDFNKEFNPNKYLNFSRFKYLYEQSKLPTHIVSKYSAELVWFTITTYVYGNDINDEITIQNYEDRMPREGKELISFDSFKDIEQQIILPFYNKLLNDGYWDRIHLIKYIIKNIRIEKKFDVIFCDEAQDFNKVELDFILNLSKYTDYNLSDVEQFPVVFAGDALQTVNPTGFRSEVLTSMIYDKLTDIKTGYKLDSSNLVFTPIYNYRSSQSIVDVANSIQNYRKIHFNAEVKTPQISKKPKLYENEHLNVYVSIEDFNSDYNLQKKIEYKNIIVPVNNDEIESYKEKFEVLKNFQNIISAVDAKGLDFNQVVIFGFGDYYKNNISSLKDKIYESRFFYNKLYVGVTRAQAELIIIDSKESKSNFWKPLIDEYVNSGWMHDNGHKPESFENIIIFDTKEIIEGSSDILLYDAKRQYHQGILEKNKSLLHIASSHFLRLREEKMYRRCLAVINEIDGNWKKAGELYLYDINGKNKVENEDYECAINAYWKGQLWNDLDLIINKIQNEENRLKNVISHFYRTNKIPQHYLNFIYDDINSFKKLIKHLEWKNNLIQDLFLYLSNLTNKDETYLLCGILFEISSNYDKEGLLEIAKIYYNEKRFQNVIDIYDKLASKLDIQDLDLFYKSKLEIAKRKNDFEEIIIWNGRIAMFNNDLRIESAKEIHNTFYTQNLNEENFNNIYVNLYVYFASLFLDDLSEKSLLIAKRTEKVFADRKNELAKHYYSLLNSDTLSLKCKNAILERWIKNTDLDKVPIEKLNSDYQKLAEKINLIYHPFNYNEIESIPTIIESFEIKQTSHFTNFKVDNFKKFDSIEIKNIGLLNLIVGDNNVGKTSLLEALLFTNDKELYLKRLIYTYIHRTNIYPDKNENSTDIISYSYKLDKSFLNEFKNDENKELEFKLRNGRVKSIYKVSFDDFKHEGSIYMNLLENNKVDLESINYEDIINQPFITYGKGFSHDLAKTYDKYIRVNRSIEKEFLENLKVFIPKIESIYVSSSGNIEIRELGAIRDIPLYQYGEGANKLFRILTLLTIYKGGVLLIDEIDSGIHYSRFKEFWRAILKIAVKQNTQIFATTHDEECINFFTEVLNEKEFGIDYQTISRVIQLKQLDKLSIRTYDHQSFNVAYNDDIEIRG
ncbi:MAG: AAA family ATPase [Crocinitomicaceae bacterium]|nr:AAA family ATPase [Crocinitomicaceae bacterium]